MVDFGIMMAVVVVAGSGSETVMAFVAVETGIMMMTLLIMAVGFGTAMRAVVLVVAVVVPAGLETRKEAD